MTSVFFLISDEGELVFTFWINLKEYVWLFVMDTIIFFGVFLLLKIFHHLSPSESGVILSFCGFHLDEKQKWESHRCYSSPVSAVLTSFNWPGKKENRYSENNYWVVSQCILGGFGGSIIKWSIQFLWFKKFVLYQSVTPCKVREFKNRMEC